MQYLNNISLQQSIILFYSNRFFNFYYLVNKTIEKSYTLNNLTRFTLLTTIK